MDGYAIIKALKDGKSSATVLRDTQRYIRPLLAGKVKETEAGEYSVFSLKMLRQCVVSLAERSDDKDEILQICGYAYECVYKTQSVHQPAAMAVEKLLFHVMVQAVKLGNLKEVERFAKFLYKQLSQSQNDLEKGDGNHGKDLDNIAKQSFNTLYKASLDIKTDPDSRAWTLCFRTQAIKFALLSQSELTWVLDHAWKITLPMIRARQTPGKEDATLEEYTETVNNKVIRRLIQDKENNGSLKREDVTALLQWTIKFCHACNSEKGFDLLRSILNAVNHLLEYDADLKKKANLCLSIAKLGFLLTGSVAETSTVGLLESVLKYLKQILAKGMEGDFLQCVIMAGDVLRKKLEQESNQTAGYCESLRVQVVNFLTRQMELLEFRQKSENSTDQQKQQDTSAQLCTWSLICRLLITRMGTSSTTQLQNLCSPVCKKIANVLETVSGDGGVAMSINEHNIIGTNCYNLGVTLYKMESYNDCTELLRLACQQLHLWCCNGTGDLDNDRQEKVHLVKKYELLINCQRKAGCHSDAMATAASAISIFGHMSEAMHSLVYLWIRAKHEWCKPNSDVQQRTKTLKDYMRDEDIGTVTMVLQMEYSIYKEQSFDTDFEEYGVLCDLLSIYDGSGDTTDSRAYYLLQLVKLLYVSQLECECKLEDCIQEAVSLLEECITQREAGEITDLLAVSCVWNFICQTTGSDTEDVAVDSNIESINIDHTLSQEQDTLKPLHKALELWQGEFAPYDVHETCHALTLMAAIFHLHYKEPERALTLQLLGNTASQAELHAIATMAYAEAAKVCCHLGNRAQAENLIKRSSENLADVKESCNREMVAVMYSVMKCWCMVYSKKFSEAKTLLEDINKQQCIHRSNRWAYLLKAELKELTATYMMAYGYATTLEDDTPQELMYESLRLRQGVDRLGHVIDATSKVQWGIDAWSIRAVLLRSCHQVGRLYNKQCAVREARCYLSEGLVIANKLQLPTRCAEFLVELFSLTVLRGVKLKDCQNYLQNVKDIITGTDGKKMKMDVKDEEASQEEEDDFIISKPIDFLDYLSDHEDQADKHSPLLSCDNVSWSPNVVDDVTVNRIQLQMGVVYLEYLETYCHSDGGEITNLISALDDFREDACDAMRDQVDAVAREATKERKRKLAGSKSERAHLDVGTEIDFLLWVARRSLAEGDAERARRRLKDADALWEYGDATCQAKILYHKVLLQLESEGCDSWCDKQWMQHAMFQDSRDEMFADSRDDIITDLSVQLNQCHLSPGRHADKNDETTLVTMTQNLKLNMSDIEKLENIEKCFSVKKGRRTKKMRPVDEEESMDVADCHSNDDGKTSSRRSKVSTSRRTRDTSHGKKDNQSGSMSSRSRIRTNDHGKASREESGEDGTGLSGVGINSRNPGNEVGEMTEVPDGETEGRKRAGKSAGKTRGKGDSGVKSGRGKYKKRDSDDVFSAEVLSEVREGGDDCVEQGIKAEELSNGKISKRNEVTGNSVKPRSRGRKALGDVTRNAGGRKDVADDLVKDTDGECGDSDENIVIKRAPRSRRNATGGAGKSAIKPAQTRQSRRVRADASEIEKVRFIDEFDGDVDFNGDVEYLEISSDSAEEDRSPVVECKYQPCMSSFSPLVTDHNYRLDEPLTNDSSLPLKISDNIIDGEFENRDMVCDIEVPRSKDSDSESEDCVFRPRRKTKTTGISRKANKQTVKSATEMNDIIDMLKTAYDLCQSFPHTLLYLDICQLLTCCYGNKNTPSPTAHYLHESLAVTLRHQKISTIYKKMRKLRKENKMEDLERLQQERQVFIFSGEKDIVKETQQKLPQGWSVCTVSIVNTGKHQHMVISRLQSQSEPIVIKIPNQQGKCRSFEQIADDFTSIEVESKRSVKEKNKKIWWQTRQDLDNQLRVLLDELENSVLGFWKVLLLGNLQDDKACQDIKRNASQLQRQLVKQNMSPMHKQLLQSLLEGHSWLSEHQVQQGLSSVTGLDVNSSEFKTLDTEYQSLAKKMEDRHKLKSTQRCPVILILDKNVQKLPWESMPMLRHNSVSRMPSLRFVLSHLQQREFTDCVLNHGVNPKKTSYVINPSNDLANTQTMFLNWFNKELAWTGVAGRVPTTKEYKSALLDQDLFIYCGHGTGRQYLHGDDIQQLECKAVSLLMGCSSGKLQVTGNLESTGMVLYYLLSGCPCVVGALWDVTDRDTDRYLEALLKSWLHSDPSSRDLLQHVSRSRDVCKLQYLIGAALVVYGLPVDIAPSDGK